MRIFTSESSPKTCPAMPGISRKFSPTRQTIALRPSYFTSASRARSAASAGMDSLESTVSETLTSEVSVSLTVDSNESIPALAADLARLADVKYEGRKAIVCLVGENLREIPGIAGHVFGELSDVKIRMISQGASEINLTFVIDEELVPSVVQRLHKAFFSELDPEIFA